MSQLTYSGYAVLTEAQALTQELQPMTTPYYPPGEDWMLKNVIADMERGKIKFALVQIGLGLEVWR